MHIEYTRNSTAVYSKLVPYISGINKRKNSKFTLYFISFMSKLSTAECVYDVTKTRKLQSRRIRIIATMVVVFPLPGIPEIVEIYPGNSDRQGL